jgi:hypothetical protein
MKQIITFLALIIGLQSIAQVPSPVGSKAADSSKWIANGTNIYNKNRGNVGIGTTTPNAQLQLGNTIVNRKIVLFQANNNDHQYYGFGINNPLIRYQVDNTGARHGFFAATSATTSNELMSILGTGNVGIGTVTPTSKLQVNGSFALPITTTTTNLTVTAAMYTINCQNTATAITVTLPTPVGIAGRIYIIKRDQGSTGAVTILPGAGLIQSLAGTFGANTTLAALGSYGQNVMLQSNGTNWHRIN